MRAALYICAILALSALQAAVAGAQPAVEARIVARDPGPGSDLALGDALSVRLAYKSAVPIRFQAKGQAHGKPVTAGAMYNVAPAYPAGEGEAIVWVAYRTAGAIDEVSIAAMAADWTPIATLSVPVQIGWSGGMARRQPAAWVGRLNQVQQQMATEAMRGTDPGSDGGVSLFFLLMPAGLLGYFILQPWTLMRFRGGWRMAAVVPLIATVPLLLHAMLALAAGANLWPLLLILGLPFATLYLAALTGVRALVR